MSDVEMETEPHTVDYAPATAKKKKARKQGRDKDAKGGKKASDDEMETTNGHTSAAEKKKKKKKKSKSKIDSEAKEDKGDAGLVKKRKKKTKPENFSISNIVAHIDGIEGKHRFRFEAAIKRARDIMLKNVIRTTSHWKRDDRMTLTIEDVDRTLEMFDMGQCVYIID